MRTIFAGILTLALAGCGGGDGSSGGSAADFGSNDGQVVVALGDSIVASVDGGGAPWPARLAGLSGKTVINAGVGGEESGGALSRCGSLLATYKPGYLLILTGANDAIMGSSTDNAVANIRAMVQMAKANGTVPIVATLLPMIGEHGIFDSAARRISAGVGSVAGVEGVALVDLNSEFGDGTGRLIGDGLHPNDAGNQIIALAFNDAL
ncbi:MAG: GDSL-type esterase/lipase family protein [Kiritimatiellaeota bacterium]|nr:GDSL-type esterase/lipase family protein [Kiritimatiellota bacterium]